MAETLTIRTASSTEIVKIAVPGPQGATGQGVPVGGSTGQVLRKASGTDYDTEWAAAGSGSGSVTSVALASTDLTISGSPITSSGTITANVTVNGLTLNKLETINTAHFLGRHGSGAGDVQPVSASQARTILNVADGAEANVQSNWTEADSGSDAFILNKPSTFAPSSHSSSHASAGSDPLAPSDIGAQSIFVTEALGTVTADVTLTAARAKIYTLNTTTSGLRILLPTTNVQTGDVVQIRFASQNGSTIAPARGTLTGFFGNSIRSGQQVTFIAESTSGTSWEEAATNRTPPETITLTAGDVVVGKATSGAGTATQVSIGTEENSVARGNHVHGNLTNDGKLGSTAGLPVVTTTAGAVTTLALGTAGQVLTVNSGATGVEFAAASGGGVTGAASSASDVLGVSGSDITGVDAGSADRLVFWDDSASKLTYLEAGSGLTISGTVMTAGGGASINQAIAVGFVLN